MPSEESKLKMYLTKYHHPDSTKVDVMSVASQYLGLSIRQETFAFENGAQKELVNLQGTIPVRYKGNVYNIPVCIWVMDTHPYNAPICYVRPTPDMHIKVSKYVDHNGKIYLPYLHDWEPNSYNLLGVVQVMIITFGDQPPVYAKPKDGPGAAPYPTQPNSIIGPRPPVSQGYTPPYPVYPTANNPPYPTTNMPGTGAGNSYNAAPYPTNPTGSSFPPYYPPGQPMGSGYPPYPTGTAQPPPQTTNFPPYPTQTQGVAAGGSGTITEEHIRASLLSAVEDKLRRRLREQFSQGSAELETLRRTNQELVQGKSRLESLVGRLEHESGELDKSISVLKEKEGELEKGLAKLADQEAIDVDEAVTTTAPLYKQLLNAFAEESATEDAIYYLGEALRQGVIDLDVFLKQVRTLSRKQFMLRALMHRCRQKAGLAG